MSILRLVINILLIIGVSNCIYAQELDWAFLIGGSAGHDQANGIITDDYNNIYITGTFSETVDFDPDPTGEFNITSNGHRDIYLAKYDSSGALVWAFGIGSDPTNSNGDIGEALALDSGGNIFITGIIVGDVDFDPSENEAILTGSGGNDFFIAKYDYSGNYLWADRGGSSYYEPSFSNSIAVDQNNCAIITGSFNRRITIGSNSLDVGSGNTGAFLAKYSPAGTVLYATELGGADYAGGEAVVCGTTGDIYIMGSFRGSDMFGTFELSGGPSVSVFICKIGPIGEVYWARELVSSSSIVGKDIGIDQHDNLYITGDYYDTIDADPSGSIITLSSNGSSDIFLLSLDVFGEYRWGLSIGNADTDYVYGLGVSSKQEVGITGRFNGELDADPSVNSSSLSSGGAEDAFLATYSFAGDFRWATSFEDQAAHTDQGLSLTYDNSNNVLCTGYISGSADFDPQTGETILSTSGSEDSYIVKLSGLDTFPHSPMILHVPEVYATIQLGLNAADSTDTVLIQPDTYYETIIWPESKGVKLISAGDSSNTIIDGGGISRVIELNPLNTLIDTTTIIQGVSITNGGNIDVGSGIYLNNASPTLIGLKIHDNSASSYGGGIYMENSTSKISGGSCFSNDATRGGGFFVSNSSPMIQGTSLVGNNSTNRGGGIYIIDSSPIIEETTISHNSGSIGGGIYAHSSSLDMSHSTISFNHSANNGGGIWVGSSSITLSEVSVNDNSCVELGGGICTDFAYDVIFENISVVNNTAANKGGGIHLWYTDAQIDNSRILGNEATINGGGVSIRHNSNATISNFTIAGNSSSGLGSGIHIYNSNPTFTEGTIASDSRTEGAVIYAELIETTPLFENVTALSDVETAILVQDAIINISGSNIVSNRFGMFNLDDLNEVNAPGNYWGHSSGPNHPIQNPLGLGDSVNQSVNIIPWLSFPDIDAPPIPAMGIEVVGVGEDFITLNWDSSPLGDFDSFNLYYDSDSSGFPYANSLDIGANTSFTLNGLESATRYYIAISTIDTDGNESWFSEEVVGTTRIMEIQNLDIAGTEELQHITTHDPLVTFDYFDSMGESQTTHHIQLGQDATFQTIIWDSGEVAGNEIAIPVPAGLLENGQSYHIRVKVASGDFWSDWSSLSFRMNTDPTGPIQVSLIHNAVSAGEVILEVVNSNDPENDTLTYDFRIFEDAALTNQLDSAIALAQGATNSSWTVNSTLEDNAQYWWTVNSFDGYEYSSTVGPESFLVNYENDIPGEFALLFPTLGGNSNSLTPILSWQYSYDPDPLDTLSYTLYLDTPAPGVELYSTGLDTFFQVIEPLVDNTSYHWKVVVEDLHGGSRESIGGYQSFTVNTENDLPVAFNLLTPIADMMVTMLSPEFIWEASADPDDATIALRETGKGNFSEDRGAGNNSVTVITGYEFYLSTDVLLTDVASVEVIGTSYIPAEVLLENQVYYWAVSAVDDSGGVTFSDTASFWTNSYNDHPSAFSMLEPVGDFLFELDMLTPTYSWSQSLDPDLYDEVVYHLNLWHSPWHSEEIYVGSDTSYTHFEPLLDNYVYSWEVIAEDMSGAMTAAGIGDSVAQIHFYTNTENDIPEPAVLLSPDSVVVLTSIPTFIWEPSFDRDPFEDIEYELQWWYEGGEMDSILTLGTSETIPEPLVYDNYQYYWQVITMDDEGGIAHSENKTFWVDFLPEPPGLFALSGPGDESSGNSTRPEMTWQAAIDPDPFDHVYYTIDIATDSTMLNVVYEGVAIPEIHMPEVDLQNDTRYYWQVSAHDEDSLLTLSDVWTFDVGYVAIDDLVNLPTEYMLDQNYPNPFNPSTTIRYGLPEEANVSLVIYDVRGQVIQTIASGHQSAGWYDVVWNGETADGRTISTGIYFARLVAGDYSQVVKMLYLK